MGLMTAVSEHVIYTVPGWIRTLTDEILIGCLTPFGFMGQIGFRYWTPEDPQNPSQSWIIAAYPVPNVLRGPGPEDGVVFVSGFRFNVTKLIDAFAKIDDLVWNCPASYGVGMDGPEISIKGVFQGKPVWLRFFHVPPPDEKPVLAINQQTLEITELIG